MSRADWSTLPDLSAKRIRLAAIMKRVFPVTTRSRLATAVAAVLVLLALAACTPTGSQSEHVTPTAQPVYPRVRTYPDIPVNHNVSYGSVAGTPLELDVCLPKAAKTATPRAAVLSIHGGSWRTGDKSSINWRSICQWLASEGFVTFSVGYRLAPEHPFPAGFDDVRSEVRWMRQKSTVDRYNIDPKRIGVFGGSAGGNLAALLGTKGSGDLTTGSRVAAVAELSGPMDLTEAGQSLGTGEAADFQPLELQYLGCTTFTDCPQARDASPLYQIDRTDPPFFVAHSSTERIPIGQSRALVKALRAKGIDVTFVTVEGSLHSIAMLNPNIRSRIADFFREKLAAPRV